MCILSLKPEQPQQGMVLKKKREKWKACLKSWLEGTQRKSCRLIQDLKTFSNKNSFRQILKRSASIYERSGFQLFKTTTGIQSKPGAFDKLRLVMNFLTNLKVTTGYYTVSD